MRATGNASSRPPHVVVIGAGVTGLATAYRLLQPHSEGRAIGVTLLEAGQRVGGKLHTIEVDGVPVEAGADSFVVRKPWAVELCRDLGLEDDLVIPGTTGAFVWARGKLHPFIEPSAFGIPAAPGALLRWEGLSVAGRLRALLDLYRGRRRAEDDEALGRLLRRRLGREAAATLVEPLLAGLHAADPERLSTLATFPELAMWERRHGSFIRGARASVRASRGSPGAMFATVWGGLSRLTAALVSSIGGDRIRTDTPVTAIERSGRGFIIDAGADHVEADAVVLATPAFETARLLRRPAPNVADSLDRIRYASTAVVVLVYPPGTGAALPSGTGFVVPSGARANLTACTWLSRKWPTPAYGDRAAIRCFVGRDGRDAVLEMEDDDLIGAVRHEIEAITPVSAEPSAARVVRWPRGMPQYEVGHLDRLDAIDRDLRSVPGVFLAGSAYRGVGIADCIRQANDVAAEVRRYTEELVSPDHDPERRTEQEVSR
ncbi:MAG TPA: protoporphyrinogen oxidase [Actinomycetota bacterium]|nr:protoporphyrinogen oxidase [Actinomycetota bacterium]